MIDNLVETNHGEEWVGKIRVKANPLSDKQMTLLLDIYDKLISNQEITLAEYDALDMSQFRETIGLPVDDQAQEVDLLSESSEDDSEDSDPDSESSEDTSEDSETDLELSCGANAAGGGGFQRGNTCAGGGDVASENNLSPEGLTIAQFEERFAAIEGREVAALYDATGRQVLARIGGATTVGFDVSEVNRMEGQTLIHNHPPVSYTHLTLPTIYSV